jgi:hypothetical protein
MKSIILKLIRHSLLGFFALTISAKSIASMPIPEPLTLEEYIKSYSPMIFLGDFRGMVHISERLGLKLMNPRESIDSDELVFSDKPTSAAGGESFMELRNMELIYAPKNALFDSCKYPVAYQAKNIILKGGTEFDIYHRSLVGQRLIFFLNGPGKYGRGSTDFPNPFFFSAGGVNWRDGAPLPEIRLGEIQKIAKNSNLVEINSNTCIKRSEK